MSGTLDRREFTLGTAALLTNLACGSGRVLQAEDVAAVETKQLILLGINALARSPEMNYFSDGHRGAAMISAHLMCENNHFEPAARQRILDLFQLSWGSSKLCQGYPEGDPVPDASDQVGKALAEGSGVLRQVGHDAIFAMHAIKAFHLMPETATAERVAGVCQLIKSFTPWRDVPPEESISPPPFTDQVAASRFILKEASEAIDRFIGFGQGFSGHMLTFGQSLVELAAMADEEWAESCRVAFCKYVTVTRMGPQPDDRKISEHGFSKLRPDEVEYWQKRGEKTLGIGHVFKYPYAYYDLLSRANSPEIQAEFESKAWRLF